jgi:hypothetical protein
VADPRRVRRHRPLVPRDRPAQLRRHLDEGVRDAEGSGELADLGAVAGQRELARSRGRLLDCPRPGGRVAVLVAADPAAEAKRRRRRRQLPPEVGDELGRDVQQARLEEPEAVADLVDDARPV